MSTVVKGKRLVAEHFAVTTRTVLNWEKQGMPRRADRTYDLVEIAKWREGLITHPQPAAPGGADPRQPILTEQRGQRFQQERLLKAKAELTEMEVRQRRGELVEVREVSKMFVARILAVKQGLLGLGRLLPPLLVDRGEREMEAIINERVRDLLENYSRQVSINPPDSSEPVSRREILQFVHGLLDSWEIPPDPEEEGGAADSSGE